MSRAYYNEIDPYAAQWLRNLITAGEIPAGDVDERPIEEVSADDVREYTQCHFFAGIGGWAYAARLAGWPDDRTLWTGSCPCQPFSAAGKQLADRDPRNLWPVFARLIAECRPAKIAGEQVASKAGRLWLAGVREDLEALGYAVGGADLCAAGVGAPHIRQRLWWVADADGGDSCTEGIQRSREQRQRSENGGNCWEASEWVKCADGRCRRIEPGIEPLVNGSPGFLDRMRAYGNSIVPAEAAEILDFLKGVDYRYSCLGCGQENIPEQDMHEGRHAKLMADGDVDFCGPVVEIKE